MRSRAGRAALGAVVATVLTTSALVAQAGETPLPDGTKRLAGQTRYETSAAISMASFSAPVDAVFVATGSAYPDALAGGPLAARTGAPVLLIGKDSIRDAVRDELVRLSPGTVYVLGGSASVSNSMVRELGSITGATVVRLSGEDRYETAVDVSRHGWTSASTVFLTSGRAFPDALSGGAAAAHRDSPLLLTNPKSLSAPTRSELVRLSPATVYVLGGTAAVSGSVVSSVRAALPDARVVRISGDDRYATSAAIADRMWPSGAAAMFFASGLKFPDALSGTPAAHVNGAPLLLTRQGCLPRDVIDLRDQFAPATQAVLGGTAAIADTALRKECGANRYSGSGDDVIPITKPGGADRPAIVSATHDGSSNFIVWGLDRNLSQTDLLVNTIGDYRGNVLLDESFGTITPSRHLSIQADGRWTVSVRSVSSARALGSSTSGSGDDVLSWTGSARTARFTHDGSGNFIVWALQRDGTMIDLLVNEIGSYDGTVAIPSGTRLLTVEADGGWTITLR